MPKADVVVVGAGLSGLTAAVALADAGARVEVIAAGHAATHWSNGGLDVAAPAGSGTPSDGIRRLRGVAGHPYGLLADALPDALAFVRSVLDGEGLEYVGHLDDELRPVPTAIGGTRPAAIVPFAQSAALPAWAPDERLIVAGPATFKDFWPAAVAAGLSRPDAWHGSGTRPGRIDQAALEWPSLDGRHNLNALVLARLFDDAAWRTTALETVARVVDRSRGRSVRVALPAVLGLTDHRAGIDAAHMIVGAPVLEIPLVPPSVPGMRLYGALRAALRRRGGRLVVGESVLAVEVTGRRVVAVRASAAARERRIAAGALVLATGGIAGGGLVGRPDGSVEEPLLGLATHVPGDGPLLGATPLDPQGHPVERAGIAVDPDLRPLESAGRAALDNVAIVGGMLAGQRYLTERCGDGVAIASGWLAAMRFGRPAAVPGATRGPAPELVRR